MYAQDNNPLPVWIILSPAYHHISINSQPFLVGIVSVFATEDYFAAAYPMEAKSMAGDALKEFITDFGVPDMIVMNGAAEQMGRKTIFIQQVETPY